MKSPSLNFLEEAENQFLVNISKCENRCFLSSEALG